LAELICLLMGVVLIVVGAVRRFRPDHAYALSVWSTTGRAMMPRRDSTWDVWRKRTAMLTLLAGLFFLATALYLLGCELPEK
jgi:hypothetical protein